MEEIIEKNIKYINNNEYKITRMDVMKNPCNDMLEPVFYFKPNQEFINIAKFNKNRLWIIITGCGKYTTFNPVLAIVDENNYGCQPNFSFQSREYMLILRNTIFQGLEDNLGKFNLCYHKIKYPLSKNIEPHFNLHDMIMFEKYIHKATNYFEYGSGGSTLSAEKLENIKKIYTVESDIQWFKLLKKKFKNSNKIKFLFIDLQSEPNDWGNPGKNSNQKDWINYSSQFGNLSDKEKKDIDLILIDGRFRVACCLKCFNGMDPNCLIIFDDFLNRPKYHEILNYFDIIDYTRNNRMVVLRKKNVRAPSLDLIKKYEKNSS